MGWEAWITLGIIGFLAVALVRGLAGPDTILLGGMTILVALGVFSEAFPTATEAVRGFGNEAVVTIGVLFVIAEGLSRTGAMELATRRLLGRPETVRGAQLRMLPAVMGLSAFLNNTPIVAMFIPVTSDWCKKTGLSPSKLLIPLSYAAILGGSCTLIGTATNVLVSGMVNAAQAGGEALGPMNAAGGRAAIELGMFSISWVGIPAALVGLGYLLLMSDRLLPERRSGVGAFDEGAEDGAGRRFTVEMMVTREAPFAGQSVEQAGLRNLPGAYLVEIDRVGQRLVAVGPDQTLHVGDRLIFAGVVDSVVDLQKIRGLIPATDEIFKLDDPRPNRRLVEAVVSPQHPMIGQTIREGGFRSRYSAAVIAAHRGGQRLNQRLGDIRLQPGDTLLLDTHPRFVTQQRNRQDFILVSAVAGSDAARHERAWVALGLLITMVLLTTLTPMKLVTAALLAGGGMILTGCCTPEQARQSVNWRVLLMMGGALGIGAALESTRAAVSVAEMLVQGFAPLGPVAILAAIYLAAMGVTSLIGPIGTVAMMFPVAKAAALSAGLNFEPFALTLMMTAAASFATPTYQTNLMVYGIGGYRFADYVRIGLPLNLLVMGVTLTIAPIVWPL